MSDSALPAVPVRALQVLGRWNRFAQAFKPFAPTCSCCIDLGVQSTQDLEMSLLYHLGDLYAGNEPFRQLLRAGAGYEPGAAGSVVKLLQAMARSSVSAAAQVQHQLLDDIEAALSIAESNQPTPHEQPGAS
jgi:hypothetical protein